MDSVFEKMTKDAAHAIRRMQFALDTDLLVPAKLDETSLLFRTEQGMDAYVKWAVSHGIEHTFSVRQDYMQVEGSSDHMEALPHVDGRGCGFNVRFEFLLLPGADWRIECMCVKDGCAPLHTARLAEGHNGTPIHVSYKPGNYDAAKRTLAQSNLEMSAEYRNTYGRFSYWKYGNIYIKPRRSFADHPEL